MRAAETVSESVFKQPMKMWRIPTVVTIHEAEIKREQNRRLPLEIFALGKENYVSLKTGSSSRG